MESQGTHKLRSEGKSRFEAFSIITILLTPQKCVLLVLYVCLCLFLCVTCMQQKLWVASLYMWRLQERERQHKVHTRQAPILRQPRVDNRYTPIGKLFTRYHSYKFYNHLLVKIEQCFGCVVGEWLQVNDTNLCTSLKLFVN